MTLDNLTPSYTKEDMENSWRDGFDKGFCWAKNENYDRYEGRSLPEVEAYELNKFLHE